MRLESITIKKCSSGVTIEIVIKRKLFESSKRFRARVEEALQIKYEGEGHFETYWGEDFRTRIICIIIPHFETYIDLVKNLKCANGVCKL